MKLVALWLAGIVLALAAAGSCSINHRSGDFACENSRDCSPGRVCIDGFCVTGGQPLDAGIDAGFDAPPPDAAIDAPPPIDARPQCPAQCTSCELDAKTCKIDCALDPILCTRLITCPLGFSCEIDCSTERGCRAGVICDDTNPTCTIGCGGNSSCRNVVCGAGSCDVNCTGTNSCSNVDCGPGKCNVDCAGVDACVDVDCGPACACDLRCGFDSRCLPTTCPADNKCSDGLDGCTSQPLGCNVCQ